MGCKEERAIQGDPLFLGNGGDSAVLYEDEKGVGWRQDVGINSPDLRILNVRYQMEMLEGKRIGQDVLGMCNLWQFKPREC